MSTQSPGPRILAPAPTPLAKPPESEGSSPGSTLSSSTNAIKRASTACRSCKQIKRKCDQAQPCSNCRKSHTQCVYNESEDGRRKAARKRNVESLELKRDALDSILESLRTSDDRHVQRLVHLIRSQAPLEDIVDYATTHADTLTGNQLQNITTVVSGQTRKAVLSVNDLCDTPLVRVPSKPWTTITDDGEFVSHLMSIYFTWFHIAYPIMDKHLFLTDMASGNLDSQFCSPLLVNSMLTMACHFSDHPRACKIPSDSNTRGRHFLDEAVRLWNEQEGRPSLLNIQAVSMLAVAFTLIGKDRLSWSYLEQMNRMLEEHTFRTTQAETRGEKPVSAQMRRSQILTARTCFLLTVGFGSAFMKPSNAIPVADTRSTPFSILEQNILWTPYPQRNPEVTIALEDLHKAYYSLHEVGFEIQQIHFGDGQMIQRQEVRRLDERLEGWKRDLPEELQLSNDSAILKPPIMDLHLTYNWFRITLYNFLKSPSTTSIPLSESDATQIQAHSKILESAKAIAGLCGSYARDYGLKQPTIWMPQTAVSTAHSLVGALSHPVHGSVVQDIFHELCLVLVAASQRWLVMKGHVRMLFLTADEKGQKLPKKTKDLLKFVALDKWGANDHLQFASASYPNYALAKTEDPRLATMGDLLERWANTRISEEEEEAVVDNAHALTDELTDMTTSSEQDSPAAFSHSEAGNS